MIWRKSLRWTTITFFSTYFAIIPFSVLNEDNILKDLTITCNNGRLGNQMFTYATLYGVSRFNHRRAAGRPCHLDKLRKYFHLTMDASTKNETELENDHPFVISVDNMTVPKDRDIFVVKGSYPVSYKYFENVRVEVAKEFRFRDYLLDYADEVLRKVQNNRRHNTFVGVHVRRGDYRHHLCSYNMSVEASPLFYRRAMSIFRRKFSNAVFLVTSDSPDWAKKKVVGKNVFFVGDSTRDPAFDLAVLSRCNHTIFAYGTYGFWAATLAGGLTICLAEKSIETHPEVVIGIVKANDMARPEWKGVSGTRRITCN